MNPDIETIQMGGQRRRQFLQQAFNGIGGLALGAIASDAAHASNVAPPHFARKAKRCIFLFMQGGVSQMDSFDYKPTLQKVHNKPMPKLPGLTGELEGRLRFKHFCIQSPFGFNQHGDCGRYISDRFPHIARHVDDLSFIYGVKTDNQNHGPSTLHVTTGSQFPGSPSVGSWVSYGLGTENNNMPSYVVLQDPRGAPVNGAAIWANGYLPAAYQGTLLRPTGTPILNLKSPKGVSRERQRREMDAVKFLNQRHKAARTQTDDLEARIKAYELAFRMQTAAPELMDIQHEPQHIHSLYGLGNPSTAGFGRQCLLARRLVESGVRMTLLVHGVQIASQSWDDHGNVKAGMERHSREVDQPVAALLTDLKQRGLLDETLVVWASEMGRTPFQNGNPKSNPGRDHNSLGLVMWMAGGNVKGGSTAGETDEFGLRSIGEPIHIRDVHTTILNLLGLDDEELRFLHAGRLRRLSDIGGKTLHDIIA